MQRTLLLLLLVFAGIPACTSVWTPRTIPACDAASGGAELDRERSYYAALIALSERKYVIVHTDPSRQIEAEYQSAYKPEQGYTRWRIDLLDDASLRVDSLPAQARVSRKRVRRQEQWFQMLSASTRALSCRELEWLRWEAQNRGLIPMAEGLLGEDTHEQSALAAPDAHAREPTAQEQTRRARVDALSRQQRAISLVAPIAMLSVGVALLGGALGLAQLALFDRRTHCGQSGGSAQGEQLTFVCSSATHRRNLGIGAGSLALGAAGFVAAGATLLVRRLRKRSELSRELRGLAEPRLSFGVGARGMNVSIGATF